MLESVAGDHAVFDFVVVGAGIAGASVAYELARHGSVLVLEQESQPGYHSTGRSAALLIDTYGTAPIRALTRASRKFYEDPPEGFCDTPLLSSRGVMYVAQLHQERLLKETFEHFRSQGLNVELMSADDVVGMVPVLRAEKIAGAILEPGAKDLDVHALHQSYLRGMRTHGATLKVNAALQSAEYQEQRWTLTLADGEQVSARTIVNAAGAWADQVAARCGVRQVGLSPCRRTAFTFDGPEELEFASWPTVVGIEEEYYLKPDAGQLLGSPANADPVEPHDVVPEELDVATGIDRIQNMSSLTIRRPRHMWSGLRSFVADGEFVVGWDPDVSGFFWLAGQGGSGIQTSSAASRLAAALLTKQPVPDDIIHSGVESSKISPERFRTAV